MPRQPKPRNEKIAEALKTAKAAAENGHVFQTKKLTRAEVKILEQAGWLLDIHAGWMALVTPGAKDGDSVPFFSNYWEFVRKYLNARFAGEYALSALSSLALHSDSYTIPKQMTVITTRTTQGLVNLLHDVKLMVISDPRYDLSDAILHNSGLRLLSIERALAAMPAASYRMPTAELTAGLVTVHNIPELSRLLLKNPTGGPTAGRIVAALRDIGRIKEAQMIENAFAAAGIVLPVAADIGSFHSLVEVSARLKSGIAARLATLWTTMSASLSDLQHPEKNLAEFQAATSDEIRKSIKEVYANDAYNSLSIEGYQVTHDLIECVASGQWNPKQHDQDRQAIDALAARGYYEAFNAVQQTILDIHAGAPTIETLERDVLDWRGLLFSPAARAGLIPPESLAGYRHSSVYIRGSMHVPPPHEKLMDAMDTIYELLRAEKNPWARAVLGHFFFVYVHPFPDGNGRTGRFLMNTLLVTAGFKWTVVRVSQRERYFAALEKASMQGHAGELSDFLMAEMNAGGKA